MVKTRVMVVDDSVVIRRLLTDILSEDPDIEVVGTAPNGRIAISKMTQLNPDLVTLDIEMPDMDGLSTVSEIRKNYPTLPVIMFSTLTERGAVSTLDALSRGATDYVTKPANVGSVSAGKQSVRDQLIPKIKAFCHHPPSTNAKRPNVALASRSSSLPLKKSSPSRIDIVVIGSSTGGPQALSAVLSRVPASFPIPIVVVQHMPPVFTKHLADRLNQDCPLKVSEAVPGMPIGPGHVLIAPGDFHLELARAGTAVVAKTHQAPPENSCRPAVDVLFRSAAKHFGKHCLAVILTGMGHDGLRGSEAIVQEGGILVAQDEATSVVWGMPRAVTEAGLVTHSLPLHSIADRIVQLAALGQPLKLVN